jgi:hypothetical protein
MNAKKAPKQDRQKTLLVRELIATQTELLNIKNPELASALGYPNPSIVSMLKNGTMKLPMDKLGAAARTLKLDPIFLAQLWDAENGFNLIGFIESVRGQVALTENEHRMILAMRGVNRGMDVDMDDHGDEMNEILRAYGAAANKERDMVDGTLNGILAKKKRSAVESGARRADKPASND